MFDELAPEVLVSRRLFAEEKCHLVQGTAEGDQSAQHLGNMLDALDPEARRSVREVSRAVAAVQFTLMDQMIQPVDRVERDLTAQRVAREDYAIITPIFRPVRAGSLCR